MDDIQCSTVALHCSTIAYNVCTPASRAMPLPLPPTLRHASARPGEHRSMFFFPTPVFLPVLWAGSHRPARPAAVGPGRRPRPSQPHPLPAPGGPASWAGACALVAYPPALPASWWGPTSKGPSRIGVGLDRPASRNPGRMRPAPRALGISSLVRTVEWVGPGGEKGRGGGVLMNHKAKYPHRSPQNHLRPSVSPRVYSEVVGVPG